MLVTYEADGIAHFAFLAHGQLYDCHALDCRLPQDAKAFTANWEAYADITSEIEQQLKTGAHDWIPTFKASEVSNLQGIIYDGLFTKRSR